MARNRAQQVQILELHEGRRNKLYIDTLGHPTIGVGFNLDLPIPDIVIDFWLEILLAEKEKELAIMLPWTKDLDDVRYYILLDMAFNMGMAGLLQFKQTLAAVKTGHYDDAARLMLQSRWATQTKSRAIRLSKMMREGTWPADLNGA